jgi:hypothetical protein
MDLAKLRAFWAHRQGLDGSLNGALPAVALERAGWARSVGGCSPYLALHARTGASRQAVDGAVARAEIHELPAAPASLAEFQRFSGLGVKASKEALAPLELIPVEAGAERFWSHADASEFAAFRTPSEPHYALIGSIDSLLLLRTGVGELLDHDVPAFWGLTDLPHHAIVDRGRVIGLWDYDAERAEIVWGAFVKPTAELRAKVARVEAFVSNELGDARAFSLDSPAKRTARLNALRQLT